MRIQIQNYIMKLVFSRSLVATELIALYSLRFSSETSQQEYLNFVVYSYNIILQRFNNYRL